MPTSAKVSKPADQVERESALRDAIMKMTPKQAAQYIDDNVTDLASAKSVLKIMAAALVAIAHEVKQ